MDIFISSLIRGFEEFRAAAKSAIITLGDRPIMAEDFLAQPKSSQIACLDGVRRSGLIILILGEEYGDVQESGLSATHEEYREALETHKPVIAYVQKGIQADAEQANFIREVEKWAGGLFRGAFSTGSDLERMITQAVHQWQISNASGPLDPAEMLSRAVAMMSGNPRATYSGRATLVISVCGGPPQTILRPSAIENPGLAKDLKRLAMFGDYPIFSTEAGASSDVVGDDLFISQGRDEQTITVDPQGGIKLKLALKQEQRGFAVTQEDLHEQFTGALRFAAEILDRIDNTERITHVVIAAQFENADYITIRTRAEQNASPNSYSINAGGKDTDAVHLTPPHKPRAALKHDTDTLAEDFIALLKRRSAQSRY